mmetsp:Transcript_9933/g.31290  ORF Transcript_9933/g.31290 Transcript_9933/m.31290 type:complete len:331 (-) Transcript_9933:324-1316(-)
MAAAARNVSPTRCSTARSSTPTDSAQRTRSSARPSVSLAARSRRCLVSSLSSRSRFFSATVSSSVACSCSTRSTTACSSACLASSLAFASASSAFRDSTLSRLGSTTRATSAYTLTARTHMHSEVAAVDTFCTFSTCMLGSSKYLVAMRFSVLGGMLSRSNSFRSLISDTRDSTRFAAAQSSSSPSRQHTAPITVCTACGGDVNDLTMLMSSFFSASSAASAFCSAGSALSRSFCASACSSATCPACFFTVSSSTSTVFRTFSASRRSSPTTLSSRSVSSFFCASTGCSCRSSSRRPSTTLLVSCRMVTPRARRSRCCVSSLRFSASTLT